MSIESSYSSISILRGNSCGKYAIFLLIYHFITIFSSVELVLFIVLNDEWCNTDRGDGPKDAGELFVEKLKASKGQDLPPVIVSISIWQNMFKCLSWFSLQYKAFESIRFTCNVAMVSVRIQTCE